jgi:hypothetical protein
MFASNPRHRQSEQIGSQRRDSTQGDAGRGRGRKTEFDSRRRSRLVAIEFSVGAEETHKIGEEGAYRIRRWLDSTFRFRIDRSIYDLDADGNPYPMMRLQQLPRRDPESGRGQMRSRNFPSCGSSSWATSFRLVP